MTATVEERVAAGAAWLDTVEPEWFDRIDVDTLDLGSCDNCVCGQIGDGDWSRQLYRWWPDMADERRARWSDEHGFSAAQLDPADVYQELTDAWRLQIAARRAEAGDWP